MCMAHYPEQCVIVDRDSLGGRGVGPGTGCGQVPVDVHHSIGSMAEALTEGIRCA